MGFWSSNSSNSSNNSNSNNNSNCNNNNISSRRCINSRCSTSRQSWLNQASATRRKIFRKSRLSEKRRSWSLLKIIMISNLRFDLTYVVFNSLENSIISFSIYLSFLHYLQVQSYVCNSCKALCSCYHIIDIEW